MHFILHILRNYFIKLEVKMITLLTIKNIGIIDDLSINLNKGFNVLTGETGARENINYRCTYNFIWRKILKRNDKKRTKKFVC